MFIDDKMNMTYEEEKDDVMKRLKTEDQVRSPEFSYHRTDTNIKEEL